MNIPTTWLDRVASLCVPLSLNVTGHSVTLALTAEQLTGVYFPILAELNDRARSSRVLIGLAGIGSSGKSTFAAVLTHLSRQLLCVGDLMVVGMDGWHWPNRILDERMILNSEGERVPLRRRKGGPASFDVHSLILTLRRLHEGGNPMTIPIYDRQKHEPIPDAQSIPASTRIILIEGNYVLGGVDEEPQWDDVAKLLDLKFFLSCDPAIARERMIHRHIRGGTSPEEAARKYQQNDRLNAEIIRRSGKRADYVIFLDSDPHLEPRQA